jgi:hypothetical protein
MRSNDGRNPVRCWVIIEQHIAATIHLDIDKAGCEPGAFRKGLYRNC